MTYSSMIGTLCKAQYSIATFVDGKWTAYLRIRDVCIPLNIRKYSVVGAHRGAYVAVILTKFGPCEIHISCNNLVRIC